jgi:hypothetical protein
MIKTNIIDSIRRYADLHCPTGGFLEAVLSNDLTESCIRAEEDNLLALPEIVQYCYHYIPCECWGSPERVRDWLDNKKETAVAENIKEEEKPE